MLVRELMTHDPVTVSAHTPVKAALALLARHHITSMPVVGKHGRLRGVVSEADLVRDLVRRDPRAHELPVDDSWSDRDAVVADVMTPHAIAVRPDSDLAEAVELMTSTTVKSVPVIDRDGRVVGMLSRSDVVGVLARADTDLASEVDGLLASVGLAAWSTEVTDGVVTLTGPADADERALAHVVAGTVPGVIRIVDT
ncbi:MAG TPA: CBS domain-containing protein [Nocardioides sp.]|uniref:CBS domain-containing protein n=1 Tax=uncultured Nocardioides sp. TaxID=198441 RepID=UPI002605175A|nr:CBS domain-containing protein [uncultured Nocardioides sp.]HRD61713.1 CBS domain-containing protein [Nocardioides sp.]HRI96799.1 CBS domain-containing protein [Nocardioides sp.]HRK46812.1 CBS domain-containing protein [Nocardioides sp.]